MKSVNVLIFFVSTIFVADTSLADSSSRPIKLGATIPLSGNAATYGELIRDGMLMAADQLKKEGITIELVMEDVPLPGQPAITALQKMLSSDKIDGLAGNFYNGNIPAMAPLLTAAKVPAFHTAIADDLILSSGPYVFTTNGTIADEAKHLSELALKTVGAKSAAILYVGTSFGEGYATHFRKNFEAGGGKIVYEALSPLGTTDFRAEILKVKQAKPEVILAAHFGNHLGTVLKQLRQVEKSLPVLSVYEAEDPSVLDQAGDAAEGIQFYSPEPRSDSNRRSEFRAMFANRFGYDTRILSANAHDATLLLGRTLAECNKASRCVLDRLAKIHKYDGASGIFSIGANRAGEREFSLKTCKSGIFVPVP